MTTMPYDRPWTCSDCGRKVPVAICKKKNENEGRMFVSMSQPLSPRCSHPCPYFRWVGPRLVASDSESSDSESNDSDSRPPSSPHIPPSPPSLVHVPVSRSTGVPTDHEYPNSSSTDSHKYPVAEVSNIQMSSEREHLTQDRSLPNQYNVYPPPAPPPQSDASIFFLDVVQDITKCAMHYKTNLCAINPIPAMAHQCASWDPCANQDPTIVGGLKNDRRNTQ
ncbi:hypothetical protein FIBSPDRAFT_933663 [Athelia psychrophila]|uniref:GRF-type domain-containing protein n=1 Tax=Athelia psychrophila TaxID=1759441 RepID=A0A166GQB1_9AGAM|nr:hypothetical protein FIBSPDRAFT_933663 [Fibularhizoctonia sp. CBS 109695]